MKKIVVNKSSVKIRRQRFRKCKCVPLRHVCGGCLMKSSSYNIRKQKDIPERKNND